MLGPYSGIRLEILNLNQEPALPYQRNYFQVVTLLAVMEHLNPDKVVQLYEEIYRVLAPGGLVIVTTPSSWSGSILKMMVRIRLVSPEEINEHVFAYTPSTIGWYFGRVGFSMDKIQSGYFEFGLNMWSTA